MSATPEQIAEVLARYSRDAQSKAHVAGRTEGLEHAAPGLFNDADRLRAAATILTAQAERVRVLALALRRLTYWAQTSGGTAGRDDGLVAAIDVAVEALREHDAALKAAP